MGAPKQARGILEFYFYFIFFSILQNFGYPPKAGFPPLAFPTVLIQTHRMDRGLIPGMIFVGFAQQGKKSGRQASNLECAFSRGNERGKGEGGKKRRRERIKLHSEKSVGISPGCIAPFSFSKKIKQASL